MSHAANKAYLRTIAQELSTIPKEVATIVSISIFLEMVKISTDDSKGFDSGQAAANWRLEPFLGSPTYETQRMLWGYGDVSPTAPVGYKSYYPGMKKEDAGKGAGGDPNLVYMHMFEYAAIQAAQIPDRISGISIYNPITPGYPGFAPGDDAFYEINALGDNKTKAASAVSRGVSLGIAKSIAEIPALRK